MNTVLLLVNTLRESQILTCYWSQGFERDIRAIVAETHPARQTALFSATWPDNVRELAHSFLTRPIKVTHSHLIGPFLILTSILTSHRSFPAADPQTDLSLVLFNC